MVQHLLTKKYSNYFLKNRDIIAGIAAIAFIIAVRCLGGFQFFELAAFDKFMRFRPLEKPDERILIVGINENDIDKINYYPIPDAKLASLIEELKSNQPVAIGLDIYRNFAVPPGSNQLVNTFKTTQNLIGVEKIIGDESGRTVKPPPSLPATQVGFADAMTDSDGKRRRALLAASDMNDEWRFSLAIKLSEKYLERQGIKLENVEGDCYGMKFGSTKLERIDLNSGGYVRVDAGGSQMLINFRSHPQPFQIVSLGDILNKKVSPEKIRNKIVLIGIISPSAKDYVTSEAIKSKQKSNSSTIYGVEVQAHIVSQIISGVEDGRTFIKTWWDISEYLGIIIVGVGGIILGRKIHSSRQLLLNVGVISFILIAVSFQLLIWGWWIPVIPSIVIFLCNGLVIPVFSKYDESLRSRIQERQIVIDQVFETIHGGPLQKLGMILRVLDGNDNFSKQDLSTQLKQLNQELREVHHLLKQEISSNEDSFYLRSEQQLNLQQPIHEILHQVYVDVMERNHPEFQSLRVKIVDFQQLDERNLSLEQKRGICRFLEEGLTNAGKYAHNLTRLDVICKQEQGSNLIRVSDNGCGITNLDSHQGFGTKQAGNLAKQLGGEFQLISNSPQGTIYQLTWKSRRFGIGRF